MIKQSATADTLVKSRFKKKKYSLHKNVQGFFF